MNKYYYQIIVVDFVKKQVKKIIWEPIKPQIKPLPKITKELSI